MTQELSEFSRMIVGGKADRAKSFLTAMLECGANPLGVIDGEMAQAMSEVGAKFKNNEFYVPEVILASRAYKSCLEVIRGRVHYSTIPLGKVAIGAVKGDVHDIGKNVVAMVMESAGFEVNDLGVDVHPERFAEAVEGGAQIVALTALMSTNMHAMEDIIAELKTRGLRDQCGVIIGGAAITQHFADEIGADGYGADHYEAVRVSKKLLGIL